MVCITLSSAVLSLDSNSSKEKDSGCSISSFNTFSILSGKLEYCSGLIKSPKRNLAILDSRESSLPVETTGIGSLPDLSLTSK